MKNTIPEYLILLIQSLSKAEKRYFRLYTNLQSGEKSYLVLFNLIDNGTSPEMLYDSYCRLQEKKSFDMSVKHLYRVIMDCLIHLRKNNDVQSHIFNYITRADILFERELFDEAFSQLDKAKKLAVTHENDPLQLLIRRTELKYLSALEFKGINERELVNKQMKINEVMKYTRNTNLHLQLYDILGHRVIYKGHARSEKQKEHLNDLVLSELNLIANSSYKGFEAKKLHLLFQATYYLNTGNYKSAIRFYQELLALFESNKHLIQNPPIYYLSAIRGVLDSLQTAGLYAEIPYFIRYLKQIEQGDYATEFIQEIRVYIYLYEQSCYLNTGNFAAAEELYQANEEGLSKKVELLRPETQLKLYLSTAILSLSTGNLARSRKSMKKIFSSGKLFYPLPSYKTARLINLLIQAEQGNYDFFESEITSIKRNIRYERQTYRTEKLLFRFVSAYPLPSYQNARDKMWRQYQKEIESIRQDKYEKQLLKTFDILSWIESKITGNSFAELLAQNQETKE
ncbi:hypothetical protein [Parabacteroides sp.]